MKDDSTTIETLKASVSEFMSERSWEPYHSPKNLASSICIEGAELLELFQWEDIETDHARTNKHLKAKVSDEVADIMIYLLSMANALDIDVTAAVLEKLERNRKRFPA